MRRPEDNIKTDFKGTGCDFVDRIYLTRDRILWTPQWIFTFSKTRGIYWPAERL